MQTQLSSVKQQHYQEPWHLSDTSYSNFDFKKQKQSLDWAKDTHSLHDDKIQLSLASPISITELKACPINALNPKHPLVLEMLDALFARGILTKRQKAPDAAKQLLAQSTPVLDQIRAKKNPSF